MNTEEHRGASAGSRGLRVVPAVAMLAALGLGAACRRPAPPRQWEWQSGGLSEVLAAARAQGTAALVEVYAEDVFSRDPAKPDGIHGKAALLGYFKKLLATFPDWVWTADDVFPVDGGFALRWKARIPVGEKVIEETGMDLVLVENGKVTRNEVYFDRAALLGAVEENRRR